MSELNLGQKEVGASATTDSSETEGDAFRRLLARYFHLFKRYFWIVLITMAVGIVAAYFFTENQPRIYRAEAKLIFKQNNSNVFGRQIDQLQLVDPGGRWQFDQFWNTQKEIFRARWFATQVIDTAGLLDEEAFVRDIPPVPKGDGYKEAMERRAVDKLLRIVTVSLQPNSRVAVIEVEVDDPALAAVVADGFANTYIAHTDQLQKGGLSNITSYFSGYVTTKANDVRSAQEKVNDFERENKILTVSYEKTQAITSSDLESVRRQLNDVQDRLDTEESLLKEISKMDASGEDPKTIAQLVNSNILTVAIEREDSLEQELAELSAVYGPSFEKVKGVKGQLVVVRTNIKDEIKRIKSGVKARVSALRREKGRKVSRLGDIKTKIVALDQIGKEYRTVKGDADMQREFYETVLKQSKVLDANKGYDSNPIEILQNAETPRGPVSPSMPINLAIGLLLGFLLGATIVIVIDSFDNSVRSQIDVQRATRKPILAHLPRIDPNLLKEFGSIDTMTEFAPKSSFAEGIRALRTNMMFMSPDNPPKMMLVTSPGPGEGKTLISVNMSIAIAQSGQKTLLVDSDMRRPRVHKAVEQENSGGLSDILLGKRTVADVVKKTNIDNFHVLTCGSIPPNPSELLHTENFKAFVQEIRSSYDRIIFDSPPLAAVADALVLSHSVDSVLLILKFGKTKRELLSRSINQLEAIGAPFMGCVLNDIAADSGSAYAYSYYNYRYRYESDEPTKPTKLAS